MNSYSLIIVESPAKCKKIEEYLGDRYKCVASFGHLRELNSLNLIDRENEYSTTYSEISKKKKQISILRNEIKKSSDVILATDDDREGEAIAWHIADLFKLNLKDTKRIKFTEITKDALVYALAHPYRIDMKLVNAQKARQIVDLIIGFKISPTLWKAFSFNCENSLSAGRCQTPTLQIVYDNYIEIQKSVHERNFSTSGLFTNKNILFDLNTTYIKDEIELFLTKVSQFHHTLSIGNPEITTKSQPIPFTTSKLQQSASNELHMSPKETMNCAQKLYENGYITYMRTDSTQYSTDFIQSCKKYIIDNYSQEYIHNNLDVISKSKDTSSEAHEAIRPTNIFNFTFDSGTTREKKLYYLIWCNAVESCMTESKYHTITSEIKTVNNAIFKNISRKNAFPGWEVIRNKIKNDTYYDFLLTNHHAKGREHIPVSFTKITSVEKIKNIKQHYTEAKLVQLLEEKGIGRPSTFASLVDKIQERKFVSKQNVDGEKIACTDYILQNNQVTQKIEERTFGNEKNKLVITQMGIMVMEFLKQHFHEIFNYEYTKKMELNLDYITDGKMLLKDICSSCENSVDLLLDNVKIQKQNIEIDENHSLTVGKHGPVIKRNIDGEVSFLPVKSNIDIKKIERKEYTVDDIIKHKKLQDQIDIGEYNGHKVFLKKGKFGIYATWNEKSISLKTFGNRPIENITLEEIKDFLSKNQDNGIVRVLSNDLSIRKSARGNYIYHKTKVMKKPKFYPLTHYYQDIHESSSEELIQFIQDTYKI